MVAALALGSALAYGLSDFVAGLLSRRASFVQVAVAAHAVGCGLTLLALPFAGGGGPGATALLWGGASGIGSGLGTLLLYRGLGRGRMGVVAPLSGLGAVVLPVLVGVGLGERPSTAAWLGIVAALPAIWLVSKEPGRETGEPQPGGATGSVSGVVDGLLAGVAFALLFVALDRAGDAAGLWPVAAGQVVALTVLAGVGVATLGAAGVRLPRTQLAGAATVGVLAVAATVLYFLAASAGLLAISAVLASLYPAATVALAAALLRESITAEQVAGLLLAVVAVVLIVAG